MGFGHERNDTLRSLRVKAHNLEHRRKTHESDHALSLFYHISIALESFRLLFQRTSCIKFGQEGDYLKRDFYDYRVSV